MVDGAIHLVKDVRQVVRTDQESPWLPGQTKLIDPTPDTLDEHIETGVWLADHAVVIGVVILASFLLVMMCCVSSIRRRILSCLIGGGDGQIYVDENSLLDDCCYRPCKSCAWAVVSLMPEMCWNRQEALRKIAEDGNLYTKLKIQICEVRVPITCTAIGKGAYISMRSQLNMEYRTRVHPALPEDQEIVLRFGEQFVLNLGPITSSSVTITLRDQDIMIDDDLIQVLLNSKDLEDFKSDEKLKDCPPGGDEYELQGAGGKGDKERPKVWPKCAEKKVFGPGFEKGITFYWRALFPRGGAERSNKTAKEMDAFITEMDQKRHQDREMPPTRD